MSKKTSDFSLTTTCYVLFCFARQCQGSHVQHAQAMHLATIQLDARAGDKIEPQYKTVVSFEATTCLVP